MPSALLLLALSCALLASETHGDIYLHAPRGSNNRNCRDSNSEDRANGNRLFDSENNDRGGYSCPRAYPFDCYKHAEDATARAACNALNTDLSAADEKAAVDEMGNLVHPEAVQTPRMYYYSGSVLPIEWTNQHGSGSNGKVHSEIVIQVACEGDASDRASQFSFNDDCGDASLGKTCLPRDGTPIHNTDGVNTQTIPETVAAQDNYRYGRHESLRFYQFCKNLERNKGLFVADQKMNRNDARGTRQDPNGQRYGLECNEEAHYYPWWSPSPWIDVAIVTSDVTRCAAAAAESQNVVAKQFCRCESCTGTGQLPISERACLEKGGAWVSEPSWRDKFGDEVQAPECVAGAFSRDNHLGNVGPGGQTYAYNWTVPDFLKGRERCTLRVRYNISTGDFDDVSVRGDSLLNADLSPLRDRDNDPAAVYADASTVCTADVSSSTCRLGLAVNTDQFGRTFQDRSYQFAVRAPPKQPACARIFNLGVRGKRGNIVQTYPSVEYDFTPNKLVCSEEDCVHVQWTGSDYNPARDPNNGEGGPPNPNALNQGKTDRSNMVQIRSERENTLMSDAPTLFGGAPALLQRLAFLDQPVGSPDACQTLATLQARHGANNNDAVDRDHRNCMKLSGAKTPYFDAGLLKSRKGVYVYMSTRNNNFSNRGQKGIMTVTADPDLPTAAVVGIVIGSLAAVGAISAVSYLFLLPLCLVCNSSMAAAVKTNTPFAAAPLRKPAAAAGALKVRAAFDHTAEEPGELTFKVGDEIVVRKQDESGWWEGQLLRTGAVGIFPKNYVVESSALSSV